MAINPSTNATMAGRITAADANYPFASAKDETAPGAGDGTPYFIARANDVFGLQQALLNAASITPSGNADTVVVSEYMQAIVEVASGRADNYDESGIADAYVLDVRAKQHGPRSLFDGLRIRFTPGNNNTGASTVNPNGLGVTQLRDENDVALTGGELVTTKRAAAVYSSVTGRFGLVVNSSQFLRNDQSGVLTGDLDVTGNFSSRGIDDNATGERVQIEDAAILFGDGGTPGEIYSIALRAVTSGELQLIGGSSPGTSSNISLFGGTHATLANDIKLSSSAALQLHYDDSASLWDFQANDVIAQNLLTEKFTSAQQTITSAGALVLAHGLGVVPKLIQLTLVNQTAEAGYTAGEVITTDFNSASATFRINTAKLDATNINFRFTVTANCFVAANATTGVDTLLTNANWKLVIGAFA
jgi:hypothetical protein